MAVLCEQRPVVSAGATRLVAVDFTKELDGSEVLTGTPTVTELGTVNFDADGNMELDDDGLPEYTSSTDLTLNNKAINTSVMAILGKNVAISKAVQFSMSGQLKGNTYVIAISTGTTSTPAETFVNWILVRAI